MLSGPRRPDRLRPGRHQRGCSFGAVLLSVLYAMVGLAVGAIVRSQPLALVLVIVWPLLVEGIVGGIFPERRQVAALRPRPTPCWSVDPRTRTSSRRGSARPTSAAVHSWSCSWSASCW